MRHAQHVPQGMDKNMKTLDAEAPAVIQIVETCNGNIHLDGDVDTLNIQGEIIMTAFEPAAALACIQITNNPKAKMRYHPNIDKKLAGMSKIEIQDPANAFKIGNSISLVKWRYKDEQETQFPLAISCWPNSSGSTTTVAIEIQNTLENKIETIQLQVMHSPHDHLSVDNNDLGNVTQHADSLLWDIDSLGPDQSAKFEFTSNSDIHQLLPFMLYAQVSNSITNIQVLKCYDKNTGNDITYAVVICFTIKSSLRKYRHLVHLNDSRDYAEYGRKYYIHESTKIPLPNFARQRNARIALLNRASKADYGTIGELLDRLNVIKQGSQNQNLKDIFLCVCRWFYFRHDELINDPKFPQLRELLRQTHYIFGRVNSRIIERLIKFRNCFKNADKLRDIDMYIMYSEDKRIERTSLGNIASKCLPGQIPKDTLERIHEICLGKNNIDDKIEILNRQFSRFRVKSNKKNYVSSSMPHMLLTSTLGILLYNILQNGDGPLTKRVSMIADICKSDWDISSVTDKLCGLNTFELVPQLLVELIVHICKLFFKFDTFPKKFKHVNGLYVENNETDKMEIGAMYFIARLRGILNVVGATKGTQLIQYLAEMASFLATELNDARTRGFVHYKINIFKNLLFKAYIGHAIHALEENASNLEKLKLLHKEMFTSECSYPKKPISPSVALFAHLCGMTQFCSMVNYHHNTNNEDSLYKVWGIFKGEHKYLYDFDNGFIMSSTDTTIMDGFNSGRIQLLDPTNMMCQLIISSIQDDWNGGNTIDRIKSIMNTLEFPNGTLKFDSLVTLHLPKMYHPFAQPFSKELIQGTDGKLVPHPTYGYLSIIIHDWYA
ncbi:bifunctional Coatomer delta subunit/Mu homology domain/AP-2 complex subunit mu [Babesia duncani]|nr:bifunctional Coatomer delta subunit/Mu homology domain/AP-2 complex subunit mu [Babesia duncani]